jgi:small nuclear ribonucleoprotein (snRNP)-like protein
MADHKEKKRENVLDLNKYLDQGVRVKFQGGREVTGVLKGYDQLVNLVLDDCLEFVKGESSTSSFTRRFPSANKNMLAQHCCRAELPASKLIILLHCTAISDRESRQLYAAIAMFLLMSSLARCTDL